jgi:hypothetical protein
MMRLGRRASLSPHTANNSGLLDAASRHLQEKDRTRHSNHKSRVRSGPAARRMRLRRVSGKRKIRPPFRHNQGGRP